MDIFRLCNGVIESIESVTLTVNDEFYFPTYRHQQTQLREI